MDKYRVVIDGNVYTVPKSKVGSQREAEAAVRKFVGNSGKITQTRTKRQPARPNDILTGLSQGATLGAGDEVFGRLESFLGNTSADDAIARRRSDYDEAVKRAPVATMVAEAAGSLAPTLGALGATRGRAAGQLPMVKNALARASLIGAAEGGIAGFNTGEGDASQRAPGAAVGAALGGVLGGTSQIVAPKISDAAKRLAARGMPLTPHSLGEPARRVMNALEKAPLPFKARKDDTLDAFNVVVANEVLKPAGKTISNKSGREAYAATADAIGEAYDELLDPVAAMNLRTSYATALKRANASIGLSKEAFQGAMDEAKALDKLVTAGAVTGKQFKNADSKLRGMIEDYRKQTKTAPLVTQQNQGRDVATALQSMREDMLDRAGRSVGGDFGKKLRDVDYSYKLLQTLRAAVERAPGQGERFTPAQLLAGIKKVSKGTDDFVRSQHALSGLANDAQNVLGNVEYNSAADNAVLSALGLNVDVVPLLGAAGAGAIGYDKMNDGEIGRLGAAGGAAGILALLGQPRVYNQIARSAELGGAPLGFTMQNAAPFLGMQAGRIFNEGQ